jgi:long-chain acyl-CoA synthetase
MPPAKLDRLLKIPILGGIVRKKVLTALGLQECIFAAGGAAPMPPDLLRWYGRWACDLVEVYGMTENCGVSHATCPACRRPARWAALRRRAMPPRPREQRDPDQGPVELMLGYYKEPELSRQAITDDGWLHTGDKGAWTPRATSRSPAA